MARTKLGRIIFGLRRTRAQGPQSVEPVPTPQARTGSRKDIDPRLKQLVERAVRPSTVSLWNVLNRDEREGGVRWLIESEEIGRETVCKAMADTLSFRPQTVRRWTLDKLVQTACTVPLQDPIITQILFLSSLATPARLPMVRAFLDSLGIPHDDGEVESFESMDASQEALAGVAAKVADEYGDRAVAIYLLALWEAGAPLGEKSCAWLRDRWGLSDVEGGTESVEAAHRSAAKIAAETSDATDVPQRQAAGPPGRESRAEDYPGDVSLTPSKGIMEVASADEAEREGAPARRHLKSSSRPASLTILDRLVERALEDCAQETRGALSEDELDALIEEFVRLNGTRHESYFHAGYRDALFARSADASLSVKHPARLEWYWTGAVKAWAVREHWDRIVREYDDNPFVRELMTGSSQASAFAVLPIAKALHGTGRAAEIGRSLTDHALILEPRLFDPLLSAATDLLREGDAAHARHIFDLLVRVGEQLKDTGSAPEQRVLFDARRRFAHSLRALRERERAERILKGLLAADPDQNARAMVHADLGLMAGGFDALEEVALPTGQTAVESVRERLAMGEDHFRQSVGEGTDGSAHGHYCLGVLALARGKDDDAADRHLVAAHLRFSKRVRSYGNLVPRSSLYAAIAKARQLQPDKLVHAARVIVDALASGARFPIHLVRETVEAFDLAEDKENLRRVSEAVIEAADGLVLDELAECGPALRHCPLLAEKLHSRARDSGRPADLRAADLRAAVRGHMHARSQERAGDALDELEQLALKGVAVPEFQELLKDPAGYDPAWSREDSAVARARSYEALGEFEAATGILRELFHQRASQDTEDGLHDAAGILARISGYGIDASFYQEMRDRHRALVRQLGGARAVGAESAVGPSRRRHVRILVAGGAEEAARLEAPVREALRERDPRIYITFVRTGWGSNWRRALPELERHATDHHGLVILRFVRTNFGRHVRQLWPNDRPWRFCWGGGRGAIIETVETVAALVRNG